jgi:Flp pilus assembly protein TadG
MPAMRPASQQPAATSATSSRRRNPLRSKCGQAFVETAIAIIVLLGFVFAVVDSAMLFWTYISLENGVTEATRFAVTGQTLTQGGVQLSRVDSIKATMRKEAVGITVADSEFSFLDVTTGAAGAGGPNDVIRVTVTHPYKPIFPILFLVNPNRVFNITVASTMMNEPVGL